VPGRWLAPPLGPARVRRASGARGGAGARAERAGPVQHAQIVGARCVRPRIAGRSRIHPAERGKRPSEPKRSGRLNRREAVIWTEQKRTSRRP